MPLMPLDPRLRSRDLRTSLGPFAYLVLVAVAWVAIDAVGAIGPLDKAKLGGLIGLPLTLLVPSITGRAAARSGGRDAWLVIIGVAILAGALVVAPLWIEYLPQCAAVSLPLPVGFLGTAALITMVATAGASLVAWHAWPEAGAPLRAVARAVAMGALVLAGGSAIGLAWGGFELMTSHFCIVRP